MPVEIRKLVIKAVIDKSEPGTNPAVEHGRENPGYLDQEKLVADCVKQVMTIIKREKRR